MPGFRLLCLVLCCCCLGSSLSLCVFCVCPYLRLFIYKGYSSAGGEGKDGGRPVPHSWRTQTGLPWQNSPCPALWMQCPLGIKSCLCCLVYMCQQHVPEHPKRVVAMSPVAKDACIFQKGLSKDGAGNVGEILSFFHPSLGFLPLWTVSIPFKIQGPHHLTVPSLGFLLDFAQAEAVSEQMPARLVAVWQWHMGSGGPQVSQPWWHLGHLPAGQ